MAIKRFLREYLFIVLTASVGLVITGAIAFEEYKVDTHETSTDFHNDAEERLHIIDDSIRGNLNVLQSVVSFYQASGKVDKQAFTTYISGILKNHPYIEGIAWSPLIKKDERERYEQEAAKFAPGFQITKKNGDNVFVKDDIRDEYVPVYYVQPMNNPKILGFNYSSDPVRNQAVQEAKRTGQIAATEGVTLISTKKRGVLLFAPVYKNNDLQGFVVCIMSMHLLVDLALEPLIPRGNNIIVHDVTTDKLLLHIRPSRVANISEQQVLELYNFNSGLRESKIFDVAGRKWEVTVIPAPGYYTLGLSQLTWLILALGIIFTAMLTYYMVTRLRENQRISLQVADRTRELSHTQKELELILNSTIEGIIGIDKDAKIVFCNLMAPLLLGYKKSEMIGQSFHQMVQQIDAGVMVKNGIALALQQGLENRAVNTEVFWRRNKVPMNVEYSVSSLVEDNVINGAVIVFRDITERKKHEQNLEHMALFDQLTQLANRRQFIELLKKALARANRMKKKVGVIYLDLNDFKEVNDTRGHATGDLVLQAFADRIKGTLREYDTFARLGGDEFAIIADAISERSECIIIIERILKLLKAPLITADGEYKIGASIGIAVFPDDANNHDSVITAADTAMYAAKKDKSKPYVFYDKT